VAVEVARRAPGSRIAVIGPPDRPGAATSAAGAMLNCFGEVTKDTDRPPAAQARFALAREALDQLPGWLDRLADEAGAVGVTALRSHVPGTFVVLRGGAGTIAERNCAAMCRAARDRGEPHDPVDRRRSRPGARPARAPPARRAPAPGGVRRRACRARGPGSGRPPARGDAGAHHRATGAGRVRCGVRRPAGRWRHPRLRGRALPGRPEILLLAFILDGDPGDQLADYLRAAHAHHTTRSNDQASDS
jgi:hypothetical protein